MDIDLYKQVIKRQRADRRMLLKEIEALEERVELLQARLDKYEPPQPVTEYQSIVTRIHAVECFRSMLYGVPPMTNNGRSV